VIIEPGANLSISRDQALLRDRIAILYALSDHYLFLPFAVLCMAASLVGPHAVLSYAATPFILLMAVTVVGGRLKAGYERRKPDDDPAPWAKRYTILSGISGLVWGVGAIIWFVPGSFPAQAYLVLAFLGMSATEFICRAAYRPAYLAHAAGSLLPLAALLVLEGGLYQMLSANLVLFFGGVLYSYSGAVTKLLNDSIQLRQDNVDVIARLSEEKRIAEGGRDAAQTNERTRSAFISNISYDLRTPLNAILGMAQLLERSDLEKAQRDHVKVLLEAGRGLKTLLDDIIALAQQMEGPLPSPKTGGDAGQAARTVARLLQPNAWEKRLRLSINVASGLPRVAADSRLLRRVFLKLVGNAIKFTERGNIGISLDSLCDETGLQKVRFAVTDTGPGIPNHLLATIFEPFAKAEESYAARHTGTGVGLAVAKRLIEAIGGTIGVESEPGMGASFWVVMPALESPATNENRDEEQVTAPNGLSVLIYLPDDPSRSSIESLLTPFGNAITLAGTLAHAATISSRGGFALVITSAASADALAATPGQRTPILALTTIEERPPDGADAVLRWPATGNALYSMISSITEESGKAVDGLKDDAMDAAIDAKAISELEKSLGFKTLIDILQSYLHTGEELATSLSAASDKEDWGQAGRLAQDFAGAAGGLGLTALTATARLLAQGARDGANDQILSRATDDVLTEHRRVREALRRLYPDLSA
jgi:signal transduction histidine kinase/HPt (histidine-containing phosphotransfer) domain-containing protein